MSERVQLLIGLGLIVVAFGLIWLAQQQGWIAR